MGQGYDPRRHNLADRLAIESYDREIRQGEIDLARTIERQKQREEEKRARRAERPVVRALDVEIPKALKRLEEQGWPGAKRVVAGTVKEKRAWSWVDLRINKKAVLTGRTERAAWEVAKYHHPAESGEGYVSGEMNIIYWLLSTGQIGVSGGGIGGVSIQDLNELNDNDPNAHRSDLRPTIHQVLRGVHKLGRPPEFEPIEAAPGILLP